MRIKWMVEELAGAYYQAHFALFGCNGWRSSVGRIPEWLVRPPRQSLIGHSNPTQRQTTRCSLHGSPEFRRRFNIPFQVQS